MKLTIKSLTEAYLEWKEDNNDPSQNKRRYTSEYIFDFTTYDGDMDELLSKRMIEVIGAILNKTQFEYIKDSEKYLNYITMVNVPFLKEKLNWGTSIRGAWFDEKEDEESMRELIKWLNEKE